MFQTYLEMLQLACEELEGQLRLFRQASDEVDGALRTLQTMEGFDSAISRCRKQKERLETEKRHLEQMMMGLGNTLLRYRNHENRIIDYGENGIMLNRNMKVGMMQLDSSVVNGWNLKLF